MFETNDAALAPLAWRTTAPRAGADSAPSAMAPTAPGASDPPVTLGFAGRMVGAGERLDHYATKVGGAPDWPRRSSPPPSAMTACASCGEPMALVVQAHAPLVAGELADGAAVADRTLYLFACFSRACRASTAAGADARRWKCVRAQARRGDAGPPPPATSFAGDAPAAPHPEVEDEGAPVGAVGDDWSAGGGDWGGGEWGGGEGASRGVDDPLDAAEQMDDLARALDALASDPSPSSSASAPPERRAKPGRRNHPPPVDVPRASDDGRLSPSLEDGGNPNPPGPRSGLGRTPTLPEFILVADFEPTASAAGAATASEREASERLLVKYALEEGLVSEGEDASSAASAAAAAARAAVAVGKKTHASAASDGGDWGGETYEPGAALSDGGPSARYLKFAKRLRRAPEQCVRYAFGGGAACWPEERERAAASRGGGGKNKKSSDASGFESRGGDASHPAAPACASCGAPRWLELQLTPPLLHFVAEAREWEGEAGDARGGVSAEAIDEWDWQAVGALTCARSCDGDRSKSVRSTGEEDEGEYAFVEEAVAVAEGDGGIAELLRRTGEPEARGERRDGRF